MVGRFLNRFRRCRRSIASFCSHVFGALLSAGVAAAAAFVFCFRVVVVVVVFLFLRPGFAVVAVAAVECDGVAFFVVCLGCWLLAFGLSSLKYARFVLLV